VTWALRATSGLATLRGCFSAARSAAERCERQQYTGHSCSAWRRRVTALRSAWLQRQTAHWFGGSCRAWLRGAVIADRRSPGAGFCDAGCAGTPGWRGAARRDDCSRGALS
jgi:hypothetical protein